LLRSEPYLAINPLGRIPTLEDEGRYLPESTTICEYLDERIPEPPLLTGNIYDRARIRLLCRITDIYLMKQMPLLADNMDIKRRNEAQVEFLREYIDTALWELNQLFGPGPWAYGNAISLADCVLIPSILNYRFFLRFLKDDLGIPHFHHEAPFPRHEKLRVWWKHVTTAPIIAPFIEEYDAAIEQGLGGLMPNRTGAEWSAFVRARSGRH